MEQLYQTQVHCFLTSCITAPAVFADFSVYISLFLTYRHLGWKCSVRNFGNVTYKSCGVWCFDNPDYLCCTCSFNFECNFIAPQNWSHGSAPSSSFEKILCSCWGENVRPSCLQFISAVGFSVAASKEWLRCEITWFCKDPMLSFCFPDCVCVCVELV